MDARQERAIVLAETAKIEQTPVGWKVPSQAGTGSYVVNVGDKPFCTCPDFETRQMPCKHIIAVEYVISREENPDGSITYSKRVTYSQEWTAYNDAQTHEQARFVELLRALCEGIPTPPQATGRPRLPMSDVVFGATYKVYSTMSGRRFSTDLRNANEDGMVEKAAHYNTLFRYLENPAMTPLLKQLIAESAAPLSAIESDFAADSTGFATSVYDRWYDAKYKKVRSEAKWIKCHIMTGVKTNVITAIEATPDESSDNLQLPALVTETAKRFTMHDVSADKAYSGRVNLHAVESVGAVPYIPFMSHAKGMGQRNERFDGLWYKMWHFYTYNRAQFFAHYFKRSNVETTFSMMKMKFGASVRSKTPTSQVNEVLLKAICHNICVIIQSMAELGIQPEFWTSKAKTPVAPQLLQNWGF